MDSVLHDLVRQLHTKVDALRRECADLGIELNDRLDRLELARTAPSSADEEALRAIAAFPKAAEFVAFELIDWAAVSATPEERDAYAALQQLCKGKALTSLRLGKALERLAGSQTGPLRVVRRGARNNVAQWAVEESGD